MTICYRTSIFSLITGNVLQWSSLKIRRLQSDIIKKEETELALRIGDILIVTI